MTDKQQGWNDALEIVLDAFNEVAWQKGQIEERTKAAEEIRNRIRRECPRGSDDNYASPVVSPFCKMLKGEVLPLFPFDNALSETEIWKPCVGEIVLDVFLGFAKRKGVEMVRSCNEIADEMMQLVKYEGRGKSPDYKKAMADVVKPFYNMLKG